MTRDMFTADGMNPGSTVFDLRETGTVLAALRLWQFHRTGATMDDDFDGIATDGGTLIALDEYEIDALCEAINVGRGA